MSKEFITFGAGGDNYIEAGNRLIDQAKSLELFDKITLYKDADLKADTEFWEKHGDFIEKNKRGYGYWIWKPYLIKKSMDSMKDGDILLYADCGCEIDISEKDGMLSSFDIVKNDSILGTYTGSIEIAWNKMDLLLKMDVNKSQHLFSRQHQATTNMFLVSDKTRNLVNEWYDLACDYHNIDDSPSVAENTEFFKEHRHDQSIFSLLTKKYNLYSQRTLEGCVRTSRNKTGVSKLIKKAPVIQPVVQPVAEPPTFWQGILLFFYNFYINLIAFFSFIIGTIKKGLNHIHIYSIEYARVNRYHFY